MQIFFRSSFWYKVFMPYKSFCVIAKKSENKEICQFFVYNLFSKANHEQILSRNICLEFL